MIKLIKFYLRRLGKCNLKKFFLDYQFKIKDPVLKKIFNNFVNSKSYDYTSNLWRWINIKNLKDLNEEGIKKYANKVAENYFTMDDFNLGLISKAFKNVQNKKINKKLGIFEIKKNKRTNFEKLLKSNMITLLLYSNLKKN